MSSPQFGTKISRNLWDSFVLTGPFSSDQPALKSRWGDAESRWGVANSRWGDASPLQFKYWMRFSATFRIKTLNFTRVIRVNWLADIKLKGPGPLETIVLLGAHLNIILEGIFKLVGKN